MTKRRVARWWIASVVALIPAGVLIPSGALALAARSGGNGVSDGYGRWMLALIVVGGLSALISVGLAVVAWVAAVLNARRLVDRRWYDALLLGGIAGIITTPLLGLGVLVFSGVMTAYLVAGPDGALNEQVGHVPAKSDIVRWMRRGWLVAGLGLVVGVLEPLMTNPGMPLHGVLWPSLLLGSIGYTTAAAGAIIVITAAWAALFNASLLADQTWFRRLRRMGIAALLTMPIGIGAVITLALTTSYARNVPDGTAPGPTVRRVGAPTG